MMTGEAADFYLSLPNTVTIYRGCDRRYLTGICWSLDRRVAEDFPFFPRNPAKTPVLITANVPKRKIAAVILDRGEAEVVIFHARRNKVESLTAPCPSRFVAARKFSGYKRRPQSSIVKRKLD